MVFGGKTIVFIEILNPAKKFWGETENFGGRIPPRDVWINHWLQVHNYERINLRRCIVETVKQRRCVTVHLRDQLGEFHQLIDETKLHSVWFLQFFRYRKLAAFSPPVTILTTLRNATPFTNSSKFLLRRHCSVAFHAI